ncbi:DUF305 domain-containing protein [Nocardia sp. 004]|uniref:DUF305 domain-containing protein n=1 Tax=Nocardia sp. 004 TaxID=3385978 RepID=UPI0039A26478
MVVARTGSLLALTAVTALSLTGCGSTDTGRIDEHGSSVSAEILTSAPVLTEYNDADVTFLHLMYPHHAQAVDMARLAPSHTDNRRLLALAMTIEQAQIPEMQEFTALLQSFGKRAPTTSEGHTDHEAPGMMSTEQMTALRTASGPDFDRKWLTMMTEHHSGAITMAETELAKGTNPETQAMARSIIETQQAEINQMRTMLGQI